MKGRKFADQTPAAHSVSKSHQRSYNWSAEARQEHYPCARSDDFRNHQGCARRADDPEANDQDGRQNALKQKADARPAVGEVGKKSLQSPSVQSGL